MKHWSLRSWCVLALCLLAWAGTLWYGHRTDGGTGFGKLLAACVGLWLAAAGSIGADEWAHRSRGGRALLVAPALLLALFLMAIEVSFPGALAMAWAS